MLFNVVALGAFVLGAAASPLAGLQRRQSVPYGTIITSCTVPGTVAVTFDDGPYIYTEELLNTLSASGIKATFFLNGANWASIWDYQWLVQRMVNEGHQVGSHTWSHADLTTLAEGDVYYQMTELESALLSIIGKFPTYMRSPYFAYNDFTLGIMANLGYHVIHADIDTQDWANDGPDAIWTSVANFNSGLDAGGSISLEHDVHQYTVTTLVPQIIASIQQRGLTPVTVGECLGDDPANWYRTGR